jgi:hypothetical protein
MSGHSLSAIIVGAMLIAAPPVSSAKDQPKPKRESVYTNLDGKPCIMVDDIEQHCDGVGGWKVEIADTGNVIQFRILRPSVSNTVLELNGRGLGEKAEWRGTGSRAAFAPDAMILQVRPIEEDDQISQLLYVLKLGEAEACLSGIVDARANKNPNQLARAAADLIAEPCGPVPKVFGNISKATSLYSRPAQ